VLDTLDQVANVRFDLAYPWVVKSRRQSQLLDTWIAQSRAIGGLPLITDFAALQNYREQGEVTTYDLVRDGDRLRYLVTQEGIAFTTLFGSSSKGRFLDEAMSPNGWSVARHNFDECARLARPVYASFSIYDSERRKVIYERLLLPFGSGSPEVTHMATTLKTTSWPGEKSVDLASPEGHELEYGFRAVIAFD